MAAETQIIVSAKDLATDVLKRVTTTSEMLTRVMERGRDIIPFAGAGLGVHSLKELIEHQVEYMDQAGKMAQITGLTTESYTQLSYAAQLADVSGESLNKSIAKLSKNMVAAADGSGDAYDAFHALGINVKDSTGQLKSADQILAEIADRFGKFEDGAAKTALALALFGKSGQQMIPMLNKGSEELAHMRAEAQALGLTFGDEVAHQAEEVNDNFKRLHARTEALKTIFVSGMLPALADTSEYLLEMSTATGMLNENLASVEEYTRESIAILFVFKNAVDIVATSMLLGLSAMAWAAEGEFDKAWNDIKNLKKSIEQDVKDVDDAYAKIYFRASGTKSLPYAEHLLEQKHVEKTQAPIIKPGDKGEGAATIKTLTQEAMKAEQGLNELLGTYRELELTLQGETFAVTLAKQETEFTKQQDEALRELQKIADERKALAAKNKLTPEASALLDRQKRAVVEKLNMLPFVDAQKNAIATIANDIEKLNRDSTHLTTMAGLTGKGVYEAQIAAIKAKYDALRMDPKTSQFKDQWNKEEDAALTRAGLDRARVLAQQRGELAQLTGTTQDYYAAQVEVLKIERDLAGSLEERRLKEEQLRRAMAQQKGDTYDGLRTGLREYAAEASDAWQNFRTAGRNAAQDVETSLTNALSGKGLDIKSLAQQLEAEFIKASVVRPFLGWVTKGISGLFGGSASSADSTGQAALLAAGTQLTGSAASLITAGVALDTSSMTLSFAAQELIAAATMLQGASATGSFGSDGGSLLQDAVGSFFSLDGMLADGGPTKSGLYLVGENGPELRQFGPGYVHNSKATQDILSGLSGGSSQPSYNVSITQHLDLRGADANAETRLRAAAAQIKREAREEAVQAVRALSLRGGSFARDLNRRT